MCPACMATAILIASAISSGGAAAVVVTKIRAKRLARRMLQRIEAKEKRWALHMSK